MPTEPPHRIPHREPEIHTYEGERVGRDRVKQTTKVETPNKTFYLRKHVDPKELAILKILRQRVSVEEPFSIPL